MKLATQLASLFGALALSACASEAKPEAFSIEYPSSVDSGKAWMDKGFASYAKDEAIDGKTPLKIDTRSSSSVWNQCYKSAPGLLKPGKGYVITFKCKNLELEEDAFTLFLIRPFNANDNNSDIGQAALPDSGMKEPQELSIRCKIPKGRSDYAFQIHTRNKAVALVGPVAIRECEMEMSLPLDGPAPQNAKLDIPTGSPEFSIDLPRPQKELEVKAAEFGVSPDNADNIKQLNDAIAKCRELGASKLSLEKGVYRFTSDTPLKFGALKDFTFDGQGSTLVFLKKRNSLIEIENCERALFKNFKLDWDWEKDPLASVVKVESLGEDGAYADFRFVDYESFPNPSTRIALIDMLDPQTMSVGSEGGFSVSFEFYKGRSPVTDAQWLSGNLLRIKSAGRRDLVAAFSGKLKPGQLFRMSHYYYDMVGIAMRSNAHLTIQDVDVYSAPSHAFLTTGEQHHWQLLRTNIIRPPGSTRPITCTADHHHIAESKGFLKMEGCEFSLGNDDCLNIHDSTRFGIKSGPKTLRIPSVRASFKPGDPVEFRNDDFSPANFKTKFVSEKREAPGSEALIMSFEDEIPGPEGSRYVLFNWRYDSSNVIVRDCYFHDNRARALLLLARNVTVEGCRFYKNQMGAIKIETGYTLNSWCEGYGASNIVIRDNLFDSVNPRYAYANEMRPAIYISVYLKSDPSTIKTRYPILRDILIERNKFLNCPGAIAYACSAKNVIVRDNEIVNDAKKLESFPYRGAVGAAFSSDIYVTGNKWLRSEFATEPGLHLDPETSKDAYSWGNKLVDALP